MSTISPRTGRPKVDNPKDERITIRLDAETYHMLQENATHFEESKADSIRRGIRKVNEVIKKKGSKIKVGVRRKRERQSKSEQVK